MIGDSPLDKQGAIAFGMAFVDAQAAHQKAS